MNRLLCILLLVAWQVEAATRTASVTGNWDNTATWGGAAAPIAGDTALINGDIVVTIPVGVAAECATMTIGQTANTCSMVITNSFFAVNNNAYATALTITAGNTGKTVPGSNDIAADPKFYDESRNLGEWNRIFGSGTTAYLDGIVYLLSINGYRANFDQQGTVSTYTPSHLLDWVRAGFMATNPLLHNTGAPADGSPDIGIGWVLSRKAYLTTSTTTVLTTGSTTKLTP